MRQDAVLNSVLGAIGDTPLVELCRLTRGLDGRILAKLEYLNPGFSKKDRIALQRDLNPHSKVTSMAQLEPSLQSPEQPTYQFERHGYYTLDSSATRTFNRTVTLRDSWAAGKPG